MNITIRDILTLVAQAGLLIALVYILNPADSQTFEIVEHNTVRSIMYFIVFWLIIHILGMLVTYGYRHTHKIQKGVRDNFYYGVANIERVLIGIGVIVTLFGILGIDLQSLLTSLSIVAAAIAITLREYINDFLVGIYFTFSRNIEINDYVKIGDHKGKIQEISTFKVKLLNDDDDVVIIPNGKIYMNEIINYTKRNIRSMSVDFQIDIKLVNDISIFENELRQALAEYSEFIKEDSYNLKIVEMAKDHIDFKFQYTIEKLDREIQQRIRKSTVRQVFSYITRKKAQGETDQGVS